MSYIANVFINDRSAVHAGSNGTLKTDDVCYTGNAKIPVLYCNIAKSVDAAKTAKTVFINGHGACHQQAHFAKSTGDEPGFYGGIRSGTIRGKAEFITASSNVFIEGIAAVRNFDLMVSNNGNTFPAPLIQCE